MICKEVKIGNRALGHKLLNDIRTDLGVLYRGHKITEEDVVILQVMGIDSIIVADVEDNDMEMHTAQGVIANRLCGKDTAFVVNEDGVVKVVATADGYFVSDQNRIAKFNSFNDDIVLNTIPLFRYVKSGEVVAKLEFALPIYKAEDIDNIIFALSANVDLLSVSVGAKKRAAVVYAQFYKDSKEKQFFAKTMLKLVENLQNSNVEFCGEFYADYKVNSVADEIENALDAGYDITFILSSLRTQGSQDVVPIALKSIVDEFIRSGVYNIGISDFIVAEKRNKRIINLPHNYKNINSSVVDEMILKTLINDNISSDDFAFEKDIIEVGEFLSKDEQKKITLASKKDKRVNVAIAVLAAGSSMRTGYNKLLADINGEPLILKTVKNAIKANVGPVFVVTGHQSEAIEKTLLGVDVHIINNIAYYEGVKGSVKMAVNHIPNFCDGVILLPADMPNITPQHLANMVKKLDKRKNKQLIITAFEGVKRNPILWSKDLMKFGEIIPENSSLRLTLVAFEDFTDLIEVKDEKEILDVDFPADIEKLRKQ